MSTFFDDMVRAMEDYPAANVKIEIVDCVAPVRGHRALTTTPYARAATEITPRVVATQPFIRPIQRPSAKSSSTEYDMTTGNLHFKLRRAALLAPSRRTRRGPYRAARNDPLGLTSRERCIFGLLLQGLCNRAIAQRLCRSERTVEHHVTSLLSTLGIASRGELGSFNAEKWVLPSRLDSTPLRK